MLLVPMVLSFHFLKAQENTGVEMADILRQDGKIYVLVAIIMLIMTLLFIYLFRIDLKLKKIEKEVEKVQNNEDV